MPTDWLSLRMEDAAEMVALARRSIQRPELNGVAVFHKDVDAVWRAFRAGHVLVHAAGGAVGDGAGRLLAIHRSGRWDLPKGKVEEGEAIDAAAVREVQEECGLVEVVAMGPLCETWHTYERNGRDHLKCTHWFRMQAIGAERLVPQREEGIDEVRWMDADGIALLRTAGWPSLIPVINAWEEAVHGRASGTSPRPPSP